MLAAILILLLTLFIIFYISTKEPHSDEEDSEDLSKNPQMKKLWSLAQTAMRERKPLKAEKVLLTILKFDEKMPPPITALAFFMHAKSISKRQSNVSKSPRA